MVAYFYEVTHASKQHSNWVIVYSKYPTSFRYLISLMLLPLSEFIGRDEGVAGIPEEEVGHTERAEKTNEKTA